MNIIEFANKFSDEDSCREHFRSSREKEGVVCKKCGCQKHWWLKAKWMCQCSVCNFRTSLRRGTVMENSNLPIRKRYMAMAFITFSKKGISSKELQRQLSHKYYEPIWLMMKKLRTAMGQRDALYNLEGMIEFDEGYFETSTSRQTKEKLKRGKGSQRQQNAAVMAESTPLENPLTGNKSKHVRYFKMRVLEGHKAEGIDKELKNSITEQTIIFTDKSTSYVNISDYVQVHVSEKSDGKTTNSTLKWVHIAIANAKRTLLRVYHKINGENLQLYLDEFCYKLNRRYFGKNLFDRLIVASIHGNWQSNR